MVDTPDSKSCVLWDVPVQVRPAAPINIFMPHIHTKPGEHDHTVSAFIVWRTASGPKIMLHMHKKHHILLQIGGHVELHENPWQAILHEITEETGYDPTQLKILQPKERILKLTKVVLHPVAVCQNTHDIDEQHNHTDTAYAFVTDTLPVGTPAENESSDLRWFGLKQLKQLPSDQIFENVREIGIYVLSKCLKNWEIVSLEEFSLGIPG